MIIDLRFTYEQLEEMFPTDDDGNVTSITEVAWDEVKKALRIGEVECEAVDWRTPAVFDVRYGSSYAATAMYGSHRVRFHSVEGDFREGDDA